MTDAGGHGGMDEVGGGLLMADAGSLPPAAQEGLEMLLIGSLLIGSFADRGLAHWVRCHDAHSAGRVQGMFGRGRHEFSLQSAPASGIEGAANVRDTGELGWC